MARVYQELGYALVPSPLVSGNALPAIRVASERELVFPDYVGDSLYNSLGNIRSNPHIGILFMDFEKQRRAGVYGQAKVQSVDPECRSIWNVAQAVGRVSVEQVFGKIC